MSEPRTYWVQPVAKAVQVLRCLGERREALSLKAVSSLTGLPKPTAFRYLWTLTECGVVHHDREHDLYSIDAGALDIVGAGAERRRLVEVSEPHMRRLAARFGDTINLGVLDGADIVYLGIVEGRASPRMEARVGGRDPSHATALGKCLLAHRPPTLPDAPPARLRKTTRRTVNSVADLMRELESVRRHGYAKETGESEEAAACVAVPIFGADREPIAALSAAGATPRMSEPHLAELIPALRRAARRIGGAFTQRQGSGAVSAGEMAPD